MVNYFMVQKARDLKIPAPPPLESGIIDRLMSYPWPGNVRELENVIERALILRQGAPLTFSDLNSRVQEEQFRGPDMPDHKPLKLDEVTSMHIHRVLEMTGGVAHGKGGAARVLGINSSTLRNRMNKLGIVYGIVGSS